jgi:serine/threonine protein phosphatase PrpC
VTDEEIGEVVRSDAAQAACDMLIKLAVKARTKDNISLILARHMG